MSLLERVESPDQLRALDSSLLPQVCAELRAALIEVCGRVGGHLGASLGTVELTVALHRVFHSPVDQLVWDVGHQAYAHKLLTGRQSRFSTLRQLEGIAPFLDPTESEHDVFGAGHACTALSAALGLLEAKRQLKKPGTVIAIVGDGALTGGLTFEALNNAATAASPAKLVLNDNGMSITSNVGAVAGMLRTTARAFFESLGFSYLGEIDGHDLTALDEAFRSLKRAHRPMVVHVRTQKGRGFAPAEADAQTRGHAMGPYELRDGKLVRSRSGKVTFSDAFAETLAREMERDARVVAITPAMIEGSSLRALQARFPDRVYDVGIAEQHAVTFAAGLAAGGARPVVCIYSTFLQRAYDQLIHDVALHKLPVVFAVDRAGLVGADGATHQGVFDVIATRTIPHFEVCAPSIKQDLSEALTAALARTGPTVIRFPRATIPASKNTPAFSRAGRWLKKAAEPNLVFIASGTMARTAVEAAQGHNWAVFDPCWVWPLPAAALADLAQLQAAVVTVEEASEQGGLGSAVLEHFARQKLKPPAIRCLGIPGDRFIRHGEAGALRAQLGLDPEGLRRVALEVLSGR